MRSGIACYMNHETENEIVKTEAGFSEKKLALQMDNLIMASKGKKSSRKSVSDNKKIITLYEKK
jgi:hypothetical protein